MNSTEFKTKIRDIIIKDDKIAQAMLNKNDDFLSTIPSLTDKVKMKDKNIFDYNLIPNTQTQTESYITMIFTFEYADNRSISNVSIQFNVYTHTTLQQTSEGVARNDFIKERIIELLNKNQCFESSRLLLKRSGDNAPLDTEYVASYVQFSTITLV
jgi:uncharacterized lipoprotein YehR (DUF1307 family)